jgi:hypothetical protein
MRSSAADLTHFVISSANRVLSIRLVNGLSIRLAKLTGGKISKNKSIFFLILVPPFINLLLLPIGCHCQGPAFFWLIHYVTLNFLLCVFPRSSYMRLIQLARDLDEMLGTPGNRALLISWTNWWMRLRPQIILSIVGGISGMVAAGTAEYFLAGKLPLCFAAYVSVFLTSALGINTLYWLWAAPFLVYRLHLFPSLHVTWNSPINTPAIRNISRLMGTSAIRASVGLLLFMSPMAWGYVFLQHDDYLLYITIIGLSVSLGTVLFVTVFPQYWLATIAYREKQRILNELAVTIEKNRLDAHSQADWSTLEAKIGIYQAIAGTSTFPIEAETAAKYVLALITTVLPFIAQFLALN